jgi:hypothetical protein
MPSSTVPRSKLLQKKPPIAVRFREGIAARRAKYQTADQITEYAANALAGFPIQIEDLGLLLPERVALEQLMGARARRATERAAKAAVARSQAVKAPVPMRVSRPKTAVISTGVIERLGCSLTELNRWAADGHLSPNGHRFTSLGGEHMKWLRACSPWTQKRFARRGIRLVVEQ